VADKDQDQRSLSATGTQLAALLAHYVVPIFQDPGPDRPEVIGTGLLVKHLGAPYLVTAAHVVTQNSVDGPMYFYSEANTRRTLFGTWLINPKARAAADNGRPMDVALLRLINPQQPPLKLNGKGCLHSYELINGLSNTTPRTENNWFLITGFPKSKTKLKLHKQEVESELWSLLTREASIEEYKMESLDPNLFLMLKLDKKSLHRNGIRVAPPDLNGVSGSPVWEMGDGVNGGHTPGNPVNGIAIEHRRKSKCLVAVRSGAAQHLLREATCLTLTRSYEFVA
jgi:hypothetical protein